MNNTNILENAMTTTEEKKYEEYKKEAWIWINGERETGPRSLDDMIPLRSKAWGNACGEALSGQSCYMSPLDFQGSRFKEGGDL